MKRHAITREPFHKISDHTEDEIEIQTKYIAFSSALPVSDVMKELICSKLFSVITTDQRHWLLWHMTLCH
jgi:hypothetical protein